MIPRLKHVEPAVNRQPGFRRGAVEQSAFNNTHNSCRAKILQSMLESNTGETRIARTAHRD